jgi:multisubunit Na+/H+ antiporter MnhG subunit
MASPTATHAITDAGFASGVNPWQKVKVEEEKQG